MLLCDMIYLLLHIRGLKEGGWMYLFILKDFPFENDYYDLLTR